MPPKVLAKETKEAEARVKLCSKLYMVNPYTKVIYVPNEVVEDVKMDSWTECQIAAGLLKEVE